MRLCPLHISLGFMRGLLPKACRSISLVPKMAMTERGDHLSITAESFRQDAISLATISNVEDLSPTVKKLTLVPQEPKGLFFKAGQWVDFFIPNLSTVGGFSMCSSPQMLLEAGKLELAIKYSEHPPAKWVHTRCRPGDTVGLKVGGNFFFDPLRFSTTPSDGSSSSPPSLSSSSSPSSSPFLLLVAGGVGINPILSILEEFSANVRNGTISSDAARASLLYSAKGRDELLFKDQIDAIAERTPGIRVDYFVTREELESAESRDSSLQQQHQLQHRQFHRRRIEEADLRESLSGRLNGDSSQQFLTYICGPPSMIDGLVESFKRLGVPDKSVHYEKWW